MFMQTCARKADPGTKSEQGLKILLCRERILNHSSITVATVSPELMLSFSLDTEQSSS